MSVNDSIEELATDTITVTRTLRGTVTDGVYTSGPQTVFIIRAVTQPAFNLNRVVGGANLDARVDGRRITDVRQGWTTTELIVESPDIESEVLTFRGADWTVARCEPWEESEDGDAHFHFVCTKVTHGSAG